MLKPHQIPEDLDEQPKREKMATPTRLQQTHRPKKVQHRKHQRNVTENPHG